MQVPDPPAAPENLPDGPPAGEEEEAELTVFYCVEDASGDETQATAPLSEMPSILSSGLISLQSQVWCEALPDWCSLEEASTTLVWDLSS